MGPLRLTTAVLALLVSTGWGANPEGKVRLGQKPYWPPFFALGHLMKAKTLLFILDYRLTDSCNYKVLNLTSVEIFVVYSDG